MFPGNFPVRSRRAACGSLSTTVRTLHYWQGQAASTWDRTTWASKKRAPFVDPIAGWECRRTPLTKWRRRTALPPTTSRFGPIFPTGTKQNPDAVVGTELLRRARQITAKPLVAIGGITLDRAAEVYLAGADSLAVVRDLNCAAKPGERARQYLEVAASTLS